MALPTFNLPGKNITPDKQMAMMRTYLNNLKDDTESELYNIRWDNLSKPLRDKIDSLDRDVVALNDNTVTAEWVNANAITATTLDAYLINSTYLSTEYVYAGAIAASQITSGRISTAYLDSSLITTDTLGAKTIYCDQIAVRNDSKLEGDKLTKIDGGTITTGTISANRISSSIMRTNDFTAANISAKYNSADVTAFEYMNCNHLQPWDSGYNRRVSATFQQVQIDGTTYRLLGWRVN